MSELFGVLFWIPLINFWKTTFCFLIIKINVYCRISIQFKNHLSNHLPARSIVKFLSHLFLICCLCKSTRAHTHTHTLYQLVSYRIYRFCNLSILLIYCGYFHKLVNTYKINIVNGSKCPIIWLLRMSWNNGNSEVCAIGKALGR